MFPVVLRKIEQAAHGGGWVVEQPFFLRKRRSGEDHSSPGSPHMPWKSYKENPRA
jgi:hypothetical protein